MRYFVGVAWPYANAPVTIGQVAGAFLPADIFARYHRLRGDEVLMVSGSDAHGTPILVTAEKEGTSPLEVFRMYSEQNRAALARLGLSYDRFTDTHTLAHERTVQALFLAL
ncbi:MAG: class I tRNA ligase family protein, partial [Thermoplasmata archaeon]|nr:class I tRNA ligase family protein [Thermoplasmata archaeon]